MGVLVAAGAALALATSRDDSPAASTTSTTLPGPLREAVLRADADAPAIGDAEIGALIEDLCATRDGADLGRQVVALGLTRADDVRELVEAVGRGAASYCPEVPAEAPQLVNEAYAAALAELEG